MKETRVFLDSNVLLYLLSEDSVKADRAETLSASGAVISVQVLNEVASVMLRKLQRSWPEVEEVLEVLQRVLATEALTLETHVRARYLARRYQLGFYDALIVAAALLANCEILYSEDMQHGLMLEEGLQIRNPFQE